MEGGDGFGVVLHRADLRRTIDTVRPEITPLINLYLLPPGLHLYIACMLVDKVEDCFLTGIPVDALTQSLPPHLARDDLQQVHLNWLLDEHHKVLGHGWRQEDGINVLLQLRATSERRRCCE